MDKLIFADKETKIELQGGASLSSLTTVCADWEAVAALMPKLTEGNLKTIEMQTGEGATIGIYTNPVMQPGKWEIKDDGIYITISLREKTELEKRLDAIEDGQEIQGGAIAELAGMKGDEK